MKHWAMIETPVTLEQLRLLLRVKLAVAPRGPIVTLSRSTGTPDVRDAARAELIEFITRDLRDWHFVKVVDERNLMAHGPPPTSPPPGQGNRTDID